jgi:hypothetical protein
VSVREDRELEAGERSPSFVRGTGSASYVGWPQTSSVVDDLLRDSIEMPAIWNTFQLVLPDAFEGKP